MQKGHCTEGCAERCTEGVRKGSECTKVIARRGVQRGCAEGLSAKRSLCGGVHREVHGEVCIGGEWRV